MREIQRAPIDPPLILSFDVVYRRICEQASAQTPELRTTGNVSFTARAERTRDGRRFISLPHNNRIYENDWGYKTNHMGKSGQRISHYSVPLDAWARMSNTHCQSAATMSTPLSEERSGARRQSGERSPAGELLSHTSSHPSRLNVTAEEAAHIVAFIRPHFDDYLKGYSERKYPPSDYDKLLCAFGAPRDLDAENIRLAIRWKFGHLGKSRIPSKHEALILELQRKWPEFASHSVLFGSAEALFGHLRRVVGGAHRYITVSFLMHLLRPNEIPIIDQHNYRAMNHFLGQVRPTWLSKSAPTNYADLIALSEFMKGVRCHWNTVDPVTVPSERNLDRFLMMFGKALKASERVAPSAIPGVRRNKELHFSKMRTDLGPVWG